MEMIKVIENGKKRRLKLLIEWETSGWTKLKLAKKHKISRARMGVLLERAIKERAENEVIK